ncbi:MAG: CatB-related O-acetyltransferase [Chryseolinea sp.]
MNIIRFIYNRVARALLSLHRSVIILRSNSMRHCRIGKGVVVNKNSSFYNVGIAFGTYVSLNAQIRNTEIGKFSSIGPNLVCGFGIHPIDGISTSPTFYSTGKTNGFTLSSVNKIQETKTIYIGNDVFVGANVTILDGVRIGDGAVIGAGAVVNKDIPPYAVAVGCPIKVIKFRFPPEEVQKLLTIKWWDRDMQVWRNVERNFFDLKNFLKDF